MKKLAESIARYIEYLRSVSLCASIHFSPESINRLPYEVWQQLLPYNSHCNLYCLAVKACRAEDCIAHQRSIRQSAKDTAFVIECYAGVREYAFLVKHRESTAGYVAVSGYKGDLPLLPEAELRAASLSSESIPTQLSDTLIPPLSTMLSELFGRAERFEQSEQNMISQYLAENHTSLTFDNFCRHFSRSRSYMSHKFAKMFGTSFAEYCNNLRLEDASRQLALTEDSVTDIALGCGFGDVSYFIRLFKKRYGSSPLKYRKQLPLTKKE